MGEKNPGRQVTTPIIIFFLRRRLIFMGGQRETCFTSHFCHLEFRGWPRCLEILYTSVLKYVGRKL
jgi:hypothetical protein